MLAEVFEADVTGSLNFECTLRLNLQVVVPDGMAMWSLPAQQAKMRRPIRYARCNTTQSIYGQFDDDQTTTIIGLLSISTAHMPRMSCPTLPVSSFHRYFDEKWSRPPTRPLSIG